MTSAGDWTGRVGHVWAAEWRRTDRSFANLARHLDDAIAHVAPDTGQALDIGCGAGTTSLALAEARPKLAITGIDLSDELVTIARQRLAQRRSSDLGAAPHLRFLSGDAVALAQEAGAADLIISRHGLMFFPDPVTALAAIRAGAGEGASLVFSCFGDRARNRFATIADDVTGSTVPLSRDYAPGPFAFSDADQVAGWLAAAGWKEATAAQVAFDYVAGEGADPVADAVSFLSRIGAVARPLAEATAADRPIMLARLSAMLSDHRIGDRVILPACAWIWRAKSGSASSNIPPDRFRPPMR